MPVLSVFIRQSTNKLGQHMNLQREEGEGEQEEDPGQRSHRGQARHVMPSGLPASQTEALRKENPFFH